MEPTLIGAIIGAVGTAIAVIVKSLFSRNQNSKDRMDHEENLLKIGTEMNDVTRLISEFRTEMNSTFDELKERLDDVDSKLNDFAAEQKSINIVSLRHSITQVFHSYKDKKEIPSAIYQSTMNLYDQYKALGGNSYVSEEIEEMKNWEKV